MNFGTTHFRHLFFASVITLSAVLLPTVSAASQSTVGTTPVIASPALNWSNAQNRWRLQAVDSSKQQDSVPQNIREERNDYLLPELKLGGATGGFTRLSVYGQPDVDVSPSGKQHIWLVATFLDYQVYSADASNKYIYTEINFQVDRSVYVPESFKGITSPTITVFRMGGKLEASDTSIHSTVMVPEKYSLQPKHKYLLELAARPAGLFAVLKFWDVNDGTIAQSSPEDELKARDGKSELLGLTLPSAISYIQGKLLQ